MASASSWRAAPPDRAARAGSFDREARTAPIDRGARVAEIRPNGRALRVTAGAQRDSIAHPAVPPEADGTRLSELSPRERQIVRLVAKGFVNKTIGAVLDISPWTVATHLRRIFAKLGVSSRASMVAALYQSGNRVIE